MPWRQAFSKDTYSQKTSGNDMSSAYLNEKLPYCMESTVWNLVSADSTIILYQVFPTR